MQQQLDLQQPESKIKDKAPTETLIFDTPSTGAQIPQECRSLGKDINAQGNAQMATTYRQHFTQQEQQVTPSAFYLMPGARALTQQDTQEQCNQQIA
jgi:hypothetical protein